MTDAPCGADPDPVAAGAPAVPFPFPFRIFGVGMNKTGTSSLARALHKLGVGPVCNQQIIQRTGIIQNVLDHQDYEPALRFAGIYRVFEDRPWNIGDMYRRLDARYPGSRFILTRRSPESWWRSTHRWITVTKPRVGERYRRHLQAGSLAEKDMVEAYLRHNETICAYFQGRSDFLVLDFEAGDGWQQLCPFLNLSVPAMRFPHANRQSYSGDDRTLMLKRRIRKTLAAPKKPVDPPLNVDRCLHCDAQLSPKRKGKKRRFLVKLPDAAKEPYRWLQRTAFNLAEDRTHPDRRFAALRAAYPGLAIDDMAVVTCFFNPTGSRHRVQNYARFRDGLRASGLPVLTLELAFGNDPFQLGPEAGEVLQLRSASPMWQKERLLNLGIRELLQRGHRRIVWLDADVVFEEPERWPWYVAAELERTPLCQVFRRVQIDRAPGLKPVPGLSSVRFYREVGAWLDQNPRGPSLRRVLGVLNGYSGFGWAAQADLLEQVPLYDRAVVGGGDKLIFAAGCPASAEWSREIEKLFASNFDACTGCGQTNQAPRFIADYLAWADRWRAAVQGRMGSADCTLHSLYHGDHQNRHYRLRRDILLRHGYDPALDLELDTNGCWRWATAKPQMHLQVHGYFFERRDTL